MLVLGIESATPVASVALVDGKGLVGELTLNVGLTHSQQLLPMIDQLLKQTRRTLKEVEGLGISTGPGSFTGLRIGMATAKGLAQGRGLPLAGVETLEAMAWQHQNQEGYFSPMQNARRQQVYTALYRWGQEGHLEVLEPAQATSPEQWAQKVLSRDQKPIYLLGDGALAYQEIWESLLRERARILPSYLGLARGCYVALAARQRLLQGEYPPFYAVKPLYIRGI